MADCARRVFDGTGALPAFATADGERALDRIRTLVRDRADPFI